MFDEIAALGSKGAAALSIKTARSPVGARKYKLLYRA
jgi:hypothetical protein